MTVSSTTNQVIYTGSGGSEFEFTFGLFATSDLVVKTEVIATGVQATLTETTDYTVDETELGIGYGNGGKVTLTAESFPDGLSSAYKIIIKRVLPLTQEIDLVENDPTRAEVVEEAFDRSVMTDQQLQEQIDRCIKVSETASEPTADEILVSISASATAAEAAEKGAEAAQTAAEAAAASIPDDIIVGDGTVNPTNLLSNGDFEAWSAGASAAPDGWTLAGASATIAQGSSTPDPKIGTYYVELTRAGTNCEIYQQIQTNKGLAYWKGRTITFSCWVKASVASRAFLRIADGVDTSASSYHTGSDTWELLTVTRTISASAVIVQLDCFIVAGDTTAYFDGAMCVEGESAFAFADKPAGEGVWADYSDVSTVVGWSAFATKQIYTKKIGKTVFVTFMIAGTSNSTSATFTVPYTSSNTVRTSLLSVRGTDDSSSLAYPSRLQLEPSESIVTFSKSNSSSAWTASGTKAITGEFFYETT